MLTASDKLIRATARDAFWQNYMSWGSFFEGLYLDVESTSDEENFPFLGYAPKMEEMLGTIKVKPVPSFDYTIKNKKWSAGVPIDYVMRRFCKLNAVAQMVGNLGEKARAFDQYLLSKLLETNGKGYDGIAYYSASHIDPGATYATAQSNLIARTGIADRVNLTDLEFAAAIRAGRNALYGFKDNEGDPVMPSRDAQIICMVPPGYMGIAERVETAENLTGPVSNDVKGRYTTVVNPFLTQPTSTTGAVYLFVKGTSRKPLMKQTADSLQIDDNLEITTRDAEVTAFTYGNVGYGDWRLSIKITFAA